jgi:hypothetical protein
MKPDFAAMRRFIRKIPPQDTDEGQEAWEYSCEYLTTALNAIDDLAAALRRIGEPWKDSRNSFCPVCNKLLDFCTEHTPDYCNGAIARATLKEYGLDE